MIVLLLLPFSSSLSTACKDVIVVGDATAGDFNILMKVRDPSRPGPQVLCMVYPGYRYRYHLPNIKGNEKEYVVDHKFIGVVTEGDAPPNIVKAGIALSDAGIAYGDADSPSYWINPLRTSWDDFDWIRYACQSADDEDEAIDLLKEVVDMHAPGVSENLFVVGPRKAYVMEGDVVRYSIKEIKDILVMSNYPKDLWKYRLIRRVFISKSFDLEKERFVRKGSIVRLGGVLGIKVVDIEKNGVYVKLWPLGKDVFIKVKEGKLVDPFWVEVLRIDGKRVDLRVCYKYKVWEKEILDRLKERYGKIDVKDLMNLSRLHVDDIKGIRGMCERFNKATAICKIPYRHYEYLSCMWFAPDQCSSIYIPVHICCKEILDPYENGDAAELARKILNLFGHGGFSSYASKVEDIFISEVEKAEKIARSLIEKGEDPSDFLTNIDLELQRQAYLTELFVVSLREKEKVIPIIWGKDYRSSISKFLTLSDDLDKKDLELLGEIAKSIARLRFEELKVTGNLSEDRFEFFESGVKEMEEGNFKQGFSKIYAFLSGEYEKEPKHDREKIDYAILIVVSLFLLVIFAVVLVLKENKV